MNKPKRGRPLKSLCKTGGLEAARLDGGTLLTDGDIKECNRLIIKRGDFNAESLWNLGHGLGLLEEIDRNRVLQSFSEWETETNR